MSLAVLDRYDEVAEEHGVSPFLDQRRDKFGEVQFVFVVGAGCFRHFKFDAAGVSHQHHIHSCAHQHVET